MAIRSFVLTAVLASIVGAAPIAAVPPGPVLGAMPADRLYVPVATLPDVIGGRTIGSLYFDRTGNRLYAGSDRGLFWADLSADKPTFVGPVFKQFIMKIEVAPDLGRVFFFTLDAVGYADVRDLSSPHMIAKMQASDLVYEPSRKELYVTSRESNVRVFDAGTGKSSGVVDVPGWNGFELEAIPGKVFLGVGKKDGLYVIDAATHQLAPFPIQAKLTTPMRLEADPSGKYLYAAWYQQIIAIDPATGNIAGRVTTQNTPAIAFDPGADLLIAVSANEPPPIRMMTYRVDSQGLRAVAQLTNPAKGQVSLEPTIRGFIQRGVHELIVWELKR